MTYLVAICLLARLSTISPARLESACNTVERRLADIQWSSSHDGVVWHRAWVHWDEWEHTDYGWEWYCTEFEPGGESLLIRWDANVGKYEALAMPCRPDSTSFMVTEIQGPPDMFLQEMSGAPWHEGWVMHRVAQVEIADDARRRVLAVELLGRLQTNLKCRN